MSVVESVEISRELNSDYGNHYEELVTAMFKFGVLRVAEDEFTLSSGGKSHIYIDWRSLIQRGAVQSLAALFIQFVAGMRIKRQTSLASDPFLMTVGVPDAMTSIGVVIAMQMTGGRRFLQMRKVAKNHGNTSSVFLGSVEKANVIVLEDVITTGAAVKMTIENVIKEGGNVVGVVALTDRSNGEFVKWLKAFDERIEYTPIIHTDLLFNFLQVYRTLAPLNLFTNLLSHQAVMRIENEVVQLGKAAPLGGAGIARVIANLHTKTPSLLR